VPVQILVFCCLHAPAHLELPAQQLAQKRAAFTWISLPLDLNFAGRNIFWLRTCSGSVVLTIFLLPKSFLLIEHTTTGDLSSSGSAPVLFPRGGIS
jgi:hypothetical protein